MNCGKECDYNRYETCVYIDTTFCSARKKRSRLGKFLKSAFRLPRRETESEQAHSYSTHLGT